MSIDTASTTRVRDVPMMGTAAGNYRERAHSSSSGGTVPLSTAASTGGNGRARASSMDYILARAFKNNANIAQPNHDNSAFATMMERARAQQELRLQALAESRRRYIKFLKKSIYHGNQPAESVLEFQSGRPKLYNSVETAADKRANNLFQFPDTDPAVYRRKIVKPSVYTHQPVFGF
jgi:hypothetical protein